MKSETMSEKIVVDSTQPQKQNVNYGYAKLFELHPEAKSAQYVAGQWQGTTFIMRFNWQNGRA